MDKEKQLKEKYLEERDFRKASGFGINTQEMNPEDYDQILFEGDKLEDAIGDYVERFEEYWIYEPSNGEQVFTDIDEALEYAEENSDVSFDDFKKKR